MEVKQQIDQYARAGLALLRFLSTCQMQWCDLIGDIQRRVVNDGWLVCHRDLAALSLVHRRHLERYLDRFSELEEEGWPADFLDLAAVVLPSIEDGTSSLSRAGFQVYVWLDVWQFIDFDQAKQTSFPIDWVSVSNAARRELFVALQGADENAQSELWAIAWARTKMREAANWSDSEIAQWLVDYESKASESLVTVQDSPSAQSPAPPSAHSPAPYARRIKRATLCNWCNFNRANMDKWLKARGIKCTKVGKPWFIEDAAEFAANWHADGRKVPEKLQAFLTSIDNANQ